MLSGLFCRFSSNTSERVRVGALPKVQYTTSLLQGIEPDTQIVGFSWFSNVTSSDEDGVPLTNDWRIESDAATSLPSSQRFRAGLSPTGSCLHRLLRSKLYPPVVVDHPQVGPPVAELRSG